MFWKRISLLWTVVRGDARLLWRALRHPHSPGWLKLGVAGLVLYLISPIDLIPDVVPFFGVVDDLVLIPLAMRFLYGRLPEALRAELEGRTATKAGAPGPRGGREAADDVVDMPR
jgi:uncharacterized membrane protein YkvA (DUF1232 family)